MIPPKPDPEITPSTIHGNYPNKIKREDRKPSYTTFVKYGSTTSILIILSYTFIVFISTCLLINWVLAS